MRNLDIAPLQLPLNDLIIVRLLRCWLCCRLRRRLLRRRLRRLRCWRGCRLLRRRLRRLRCGLRHRRLPGWRRLLRRGLRRQRRFGGVRDRYADAEHGDEQRNYDTENFGASLVGGVRLGYHITEDFFAEAVYGQTSVSDQNFRQILPGGIFPNPKETLRYYELLAGYNIFPGEIFLGRTHAKVSTLYLIGGLGTTNFVGESHETFDVGFGMRVFMADWAAVQVDMRDHVFALDLLGTRQNTQNLELTAGLTFFF